MLEEIELCSGGVMAKSESDVNGRQNSAVSKTLTKIKIYFPKTAGYLSSRDCVK